jgi:hypothetical protein
MECEKKGYCLYRCVCDCKFECSCEHKDHVYGFCPSGCCGLKGCRNYLLCDNKCPEWLLELNGGLCYDCVFQMGKHKMTNDVDKCCVCLEDRVMIKLDCAHTVCNLCWYIQTYDDGNKWQYLCPICRAKNRWETNPKHTPNQSVAFSSYELSNMDVLSTIGWADSDIGESIFDRGDGYDSHETPDR